MMISKVPQQFIEQINLPQHELDLFASHSEAFLQHQDNVGPITCYHEVQDIVNSIAEATTLIAFSSILNKDNGEKFEKIVESLDNMLYEAAFRSGIHVAILNAMIDSQCEFYASMFEPMLGRV